MGQCITSPNKKSHKFQFSASKDRSYKSLSEVSRHGCIQVKPILKENLLSKKTMQKQNDNKEMIKNPQSNNLKLKIPIDSTNTKFSWIDVQVNNIKRQVFELSAQEIKNKSFQEKIAWLKQKIAQKKKQNSVGQDVIQIDRENIIQSSLYSLQGIKFFKDLIIQFKGDKAQDAGGGLLRQWMHLCIQKIMSEELGIFKQCKTDETAYQLVCDSSASDQQTIQALHLLGLIIGKAMVQNISLDCHLDYTIIRQICSQPIHLSDIYSYDKQFYHSWKNIIEIPNVEQLYLDATVYLRFKQGKTQQIDILPNGKNILITNQNKQEYISGMINLYCTKIIECYLEELINSLTSIIPNEWLSIFQPWEFQMIICGPSIIDIQDWKKNTIYDCYEPQDQVIQWFWEIVESYGQQGYKNLLHYCTGSNRIPIQGFAKLQSSHRHIKKFSIRKIDCNIDNPYPKSYTCFNRLDLPQYSSKQQLKDKLSFILQQEFSYFGLC